MRIRLSLAGAAALILAGCATLTPPAPVRIPVAVPCLRAAQVPPRPDLLATPQAWPTLDAWQRARALLVDRARLLAHAEQLELLLTACVE